MLIIAYFGLFWLILGLLLLIKAWWIPGTSSMIIEDPKTSSSDYHAASVGTMDCFGAQNREHPGFVTGS